MSPNDFFYVIRHLSLLISAIGSRINFQNNKLAHS